MSKAEVRNALARAHAEAIERNQKTIADVVNLFDGRPAPTLSPELKKIADGLVARVRDAIAKRDAIIEEQRATIKNQQSYIGTLESKLVASKH